MNEIPQERIAPWAAARSIFGASAVLSELDGKTQKLEPKLLSGDRIAIGRRGLTFRHDSLLQAIERGFSMPELFPMLRNPLSAIEAIGTLKRIARHYDPTRVERGTLLVVLRAGLEALTVYLNHHPSFHGLFSDSSDELITFNLADSGVLGWLSRSSDGLFSAGTEPVSGQPSVKLTFLSHDLAFEGLLNGVDQLGATAAGEVMIQGRIPLMDKIGYVSRFALREVPKPTL